MFQNSQPLELFNPPKKLKKATLRQNTEATNLQKTVFDLSNFGVDCQIDLNNLPNEDIIIDDLDIDEDEIIDLRHYQYSDLDGKTIDLNVTLDKNNNPCGFNSITISSSNEQIDVLDYDMDGILDLFKNETTQKDENGDLFTTKYTVKNEKFNPVSTKEIVFYDENRNVKSRQYSIDENNDGKFDATSYIDYEYDENGNVKTIIQDKDENNDGISDYITQTSLEYDENRNVISETFIKDDGSDGINEYQDKIMYSYDENGNIKSKSEYYDKNYDEIFENRFEYEYDENGNIKKEIEYLDQNKDKKFDYMHQTTYVDGIKAREITIEDENFDGINDVSNTYSYNIIGEVVDTEFKYNFEIDGTIENSRQNQIGDCWLLAGLNALSNTSCGAEIIKNSISNNEDGTYSVYFKGIDKSYTISKKELIEAKSKGIYSKGDADMLLMELAFEKIFYDKNIQTGNWILNDDIQNKDNNENEHNVLDGGHFDYVTYLLTGKMSNFLKNKEDFLNIDPKTTATMLSFLSGCTVTDINGDEVILCSGIDSAHAWSLKKIENGIATIINPHNSHEEIKVLAMNIIEHANSIEMIDVSDLNNKTNYWNNFAKNLDYKIYSFVKEFYSLFHSLSLQN